MIKVFFSYSHNDETNRNELEKHLAVLKRDGLIQTWYDRRILAGSELGNEIDQNLTESNLILLLVSPDFLASDYCYSMEMKKALEMRSQGVAWVIPIILEYCDWKNTPLEGLLACPKDGKPISEFPNPNKAFNEITDEIRRVIQQITSEKPTNSESKSQGDLSVPKRELKPVVVDKIRSGNLRVKKAFTDYDKDKFKKEAFIYMTKYFKNSLEELSLRNPDIKHMFDEEENSFCVRIYRGGNEVTSCTVVNRIDENSWGGITYSHGRSRSGINASLNVEDDGYALYLSSQIGFVGMSEGCEKMTEQGASEYYWGILIKALQE